MTEAPKTKITRGKQRVDQLGPYRLISVLGSGGFGTVYAAETEDGTRVALKVLAQHMMTDELLSRFALEGDIRIEHPNVVRVLDSGTAPDGTPYIAFELLEGEPLNERIRRAPLPAAEAIHIAIGIARGLAAAHARGIVHRDLKPGNVYLTKDGGVKVLDFGIARPLLSGRQHLTIAGSVVGTPGYLSPEQARGESDVDPRADLWALGVILYEMLSGHSPFARESAVATILAVVLEEAAPLATKAPPLPPGIAELVHRCLQKNLEKRWASAEAVERALAEVDVHARAAAELDTADAQLPAEEQRVVALLLAEDVREADVLERAIAQWGGELIPMMPLPGQGKRAIGVFGRSSWEGDETSRAVSAALDAREAVGFVAVASGRATGGEGTISGDAVRAVERACAAHLSGVAVDAVAARSLGNSFETIPVRAPGSTGGGLVEIPRGTGRRESMLPGGTGTVPSVTELLLGREVELAQLTDAAQRVLDEEHAIAVWIGAPPGFGKTRLRVELERWLRRREPAITVLSGRAESHRREALYHPIASALRSAPGLEQAFARRGVSVDQKRRALERFCQEQLGSLQWGLDCADAICELLGVPRLASADRRSDPQLLGDRLRMALTDLVAIMAERQPLAIVLDDVQWADRASLALIEELMERGHDRPLLVVLATRPELAEREPELLSGKEVVRIEPRGLSRKHVATLAMAIASREVSETLVDAIFDRTGGNPFFVEQIVRELADRHLLDAELTQLPIPLHVEGAVQSRLDHLPAAEKALCKMAGVLAPRSFSARALVALGAHEPDPLLASLVRRGLFVSRGAGLSASRSWADARAADDSGVRASSEVDASKRSGSVRREREHQFKSALFAEVAYRMNADRARGELHRKAAAFLASEPGVEPEELARHHELGGEPAEASRAWAQATRVASRRGDTDSVLAHSERAIALGAVEEIFDLHMARADALSFLGRRDEQQRELDAALSAARDARQRARALTEKAALLATLGANDTGQHVAEEAVAVARTTGDADALATALARQCWLLLYGGRLPEAGAAISEALALVPRVQPETAALVSAWRAQLATARGDLGLRKIAYEDAVARFRAAGDLRRAASAESNLADTLNRVGAFEEAEVALREALSTCRRVGNRVVEGFALANLGYALTKLGRVDEALEALAEAERVASRTKQARLSIALRVYRARALLASLERGGGEVERVVREAEAAADQARRGGLLPLCASALAVAAEARLAAGDVADGLVLSRRAMDVRDEIGAMEEDESEVFLAHARALLANGRLPEAREVLVVGSSRLEFLAGRIEDVDWRARFLSDVPANRALLELANQT